jgi:hypothetical protein
MRKRMCSPRMGQLATASDSRSCPASPEERVLVILVSWFFFLTSSTGDSPKSHASLLPFNIGSSRGEMPRVSSSLGVFVKPHWESVLFLLEIKINKQKQTFSDTDERVIHCSVCLSRKNINQT